MSAITNSRWAAAKAKAAGKRTVEVTSQPVYMLAMHAYKPPEEWRITEADAEILTEARETTLPERYQRLVKRILDNSGVGKTGTYYPPAIMEAIRAVHAGASHETAFQMYEPSMARAREEAEDALFSCFRKALDQAGLAPCDVGILVVNCSLFCPTPSLASMVVNHFGLPSDTITFNLGGMGCSAGVIATTLAQEQLQFHKDKVAVVLSMENITQNFYAGQDIAMAIQNLLFFVGASATVLSNRGEDAERAKYKLVNTVRSHFGADDAAYGAIFESEDVEGKRGVRLDKGLPKLAGKLMRKALEPAAILNLPTLELLKVSADRFRRQRDPAYKEANPTAYVPDFKKGIQHFCIHPGSKTIVNGVADSLGLSDEQREPSLKTLEHYGNTSSSGIAYEFLYLEHHKRIEPGDRIMQLSIGSGIKVNTAVWEAVWPYGRHEAWELAEPGDHMLPLLGKQRTFKGVAAADSDAESADGPGLAAAMNDGAEQLLKQFSAGPPARRLGAGKRVEAAEATRKGKAKAAHRGDWPAAA